MFYLQMMYNWKKLRWRRGIDPIFQESMKYFDHPTGMIIISALYICVYVTSLGISKYVTRTLRKTWGCAEASMTTLKIDIRPMIAWLSLFIILIVFARHGLFLRLELCLEPASDAEHVRVSVRYNSRVRQLKHFVGFWNIVFDFPCVSLTCIRATST